MGGLLRRIRSVSFDNLIILAIGLALAIALRISLIQFKSVDFRDFTRIWYNTIKDNGFHAFGMDFSNYNPPYLYALYLVIRAAPDLPAVIATKIPAMLTDFVCAALVYRILRLKFVDPPFPLIGAFAILFAPTVVLNSAFWGQADSIYTTALVGCLYFLLRRKSGLACLAYGLAIAFKLQAIFFLPFLLVLFLKRELAWRDLLLIPIAPLLLLLPAWLAGRPLTDLLSVYFSQAGQYEQLTMTAPSLYAWLPDSGRFFPYFYPAGLVLTAVAALFYVAMIMSTNAKLTPPRMVELALISVIMMPFFLPKMHDRYFYPADVFSIVFAFYFPNYFFVPIAMSLASFFAYQPTLFGTDTTLLPILSLAIFMVLVLLVRDAIAHMQTRDSGFPAQSPEAGEPQSLELHHLNSSGSLPVDDNH